MAIRCDWCGTEIIPLRVKSGVVHERVIFHGVDDKDFRPSPSDVHVHIRCSQGPFMSGARVKKYVLASSADYPLRPGAMVIERIIRARFDAKQTSKYIDLAEWAGFAQPMPDGKVDWDGVDRYIQYTAAKGRPDPGRLHAIENDKRIAPEEKDKTAAIPLAVEDVDLRGNAIRTMKKIVQDGRPGSGPKLIK